MQLRTDLPAIAGGQPAFERPVPIVVPEGLVAPDFANEMLDIFRSGQLTNGARVRRFEDVAAEYLSVPYCVAVSSCTSGLLLVLRALGLRGEVILPSFTFHATAHSVIWNGLKPVFADCDLETFCLDAESARTRSSKETAAIIGAHLFGSPAPVAELERLAADLNVPLIFDAAHAFGSRAHQRPIGNFGTAEVFSFTPTKLVVAGEGGLIATHNAELARTLRLARNYGDEGTYDPEIMGLNARMSEFHAALAYGGLRNLEERIERRNQICQRYRSNLSCVPGIQFQCNRAGTRSACKDFSILVDETEFGESRNWLCRALTAENIGTRRYFHPPVHRQKLYRAIWDERPLPNTDRISERIINLPLYSTLGDEEVDRIAGAIVRAQAFANKSAFHLYPSAVTENRKTIGMAGG